MMTQLLRRIFILLTFALVISTAARAQGLGDLPPVRPVKPKPPAPVTTRPKTTPTPKPKATPTPKPTPTPLVSYRRTPATIPPISFNLATAGNLDPQTSGRITATSFYDEYKLTATSADLFTIQLQTSDPSLTVQIYDNNQAGQPILRDPQSGEFKLKTPNSTLPTDGEYRVRVLGTIAGEKSPAIAYTLNLKRLGLTEEGYLTRLQQIVTAFNSAGGKNADETISKIEELIALDPARPKGYETLAAAYLYHRNDLTKAVSLMEKAISLGGAAMFKVTHDSQWRKHRKKPGDDFNWEDQRTSWLAISAGEVSLKKSENLNESYFSIGKALIKEVDRINPTPLVRIVLPGPRNRPYIFLPVSRSQQEAEVIVNLIKSHVTQRN